MGRRKPTAAAAAADLPVPAPKVAVTGLSHDHVTMQAQGRLRLSELFPGDVYSGMRQQVIQGQSLREGRREVFIKVRPTEDGNDHEVMALAAVARSPGRSDDYIDLIEDFQVSGKQQAQKVEVFWNVYRNDGLVNNAVSKVAAILSANGSYKVRTARKRGGRKDASAVLTEVLFQWQRYVNSPLPVPMSGKSDQPGVVTGARGLKAISQQAVRIALIEGSWVGRTVWTTAELEGLGSYDLPMTIQSLSTAQLEPVRELQGTGIELFYWRPSSQLVNQLRSPATPEIRKLIKKFLPNDVANPIKKDGKVLLDPSLLMHVKHKGVDTEPFGESFLQPALAAVAYNQAITRLDLTCAQNLINRLTVVMVGSSDPTSIYGQQEVTAARAATMQALFDDPGPNMTIVWAGDDVEVVDVGAHNKVLDLNDRFKIGENKVKQALGIPDALLTGTTGDGKAAGWAATIGAAAQLEELANQFAGVWTQLGERIALENGFTDVDLVYEWDKSLLIDRAEERNQTRNDYVLGGVSIRRWLLVQGVDPDAEFAQRCFERNLDPTTTTWEAAFMPPQGLQGQAEGHHDRVGTRGLRDGPPNAGAPRAGGRAEQRLSLRPDLHRHGRRVRHGRTDPRHHETSIDHQLLGRRGTHEPGPIKGDRHPIPRGAAAGTGRLTPAHPIAERVARRCQGRQLQLSRRLGTRRPERHAPRAGQGQHRADHGH
jgi:hypothetical protein